MPGKRNLPIPHNQLTLIDVEAEPTPPKQKEPKGRKRTANLEKRVTQLEADVTLVRSQVERELELEEDEDDI